MLNSYYLYKINNGKKPPMRKYVKEVVRQLPKKYGVMQKPRSSGRVSLEGVEKNPERLSARHFCEKIPATQGKTKSQRPCLVCKNPKRRKAVRRDSRYWCRECGKAKKCFDNCFKDYHTLKFN
jgi:hypothetical protein